MKKLANRYKWTNRFPGYDEDDIEQEIFFLVIDGLKSYKKEKGVVENFLSVHVRNRLMNFKRNNYRRITPPCKSCPLKAWDPDKQCCKVYENMDDCYILRKWTLNNQARENIARPISIEKTKMEGEKNVFSGESPDSIIEAREVRALIDAKLPHHLRKTYILFLSNKHVADDDKTELFQVIKSILEEAGYE